MYSIVVAHFNQYANGMKCTENVRAHSLDSVSCETTMEGLEQFDNLHNLERHRFDFISDLPNLANVNYNYLQARRVNMTAPFTMLNVQPLYSNISGLVNHSFKVTQDQNKIKLSLILEVIK